MHNASGVFPTRRGWLFPAAVFCMLFSGVAALIYQVVWTRYLGLLTGHTSYAIVAVLVAFMGGLALGNALLGRKADSLNRPLAFYGWLEVAIGVYALAFPQLYEIAYGVYLGMAKGAAAGSATLLGMKFLMALVVVLVPTVLMGGTLPVLARLLTRSLGELQSRVSALYFINSVGAVIGVGAAEFWLIPDMGLDSAIYCGAVLNLGVGAIALFVSGWLREEKNEAPADEKKIEESPAESFTSAEIRLAVIGIGLSGFAAMLYEIAWTRLLGLTMGTTSGAFAIMLMTFIAGIALGSWLIGRIKRINNSLNWFAWMEIGVGASVIATMFLYSRLPYWFVSLSRVLKRDEANYGAYQSLEALFSIGVMIIPTTILGMTLPLVSRISTAELARTGRSVGYVFSFNTIGAVVGTIITGLWALPALGLASTFALGTGLNIAIGIVILARKAAPAQKKMVPMVLPGVVLWMILAHSLFHKEWVALTTSGAYRYAVAPASFEEFKKVNTELYELLYHRDGAGSTITVKRDKSSQIANTFLQVNGKTDASTVGDMSTQLLTGHVPALLHPQPKDALVIGLGSGATAGALLTHDNIASVTSIEISPEIVEVAAKFFLEINAGAMKDPKHKVFIDDAKSFLHTTDKTFDIIVSQPSNPWMAGIPGLYSIEFYTQCAQKLKAGGLMCQWLQQYDIGKGAVDTILATFTGTFPHTTVWCSDTGNLLLIGSATPLDLNLQRVLQRSSQPKVRASLARAYIRRPATLLAHELISPGYAQFAFPEDTQIHSDYFPVLDRMAQVGRFVGKTTQEIFRYDERKIPTADTLLTRLIRNFPLQPADWLDLIEHNGYENIFGPEMVRSITAEWSTKFPKDPLPTMIAIDYPDERAPTADDITVMSFKLSQIVNSPTKSVEWTTRFAYSAMAGYRHHRSVFHTPQSEAMISIMTKLAETFPKEAHIYNTYLAELLSDAGQQDRFVKVAEDVFVINGKDLTTKDFPDGESAPAVVLNRLVEHYFKNPDAGKLTATLTLAKSGGFASDENPRLRAIVARAIAATQPRQ